MGKNPVETNGAPSVPQNNAREMSVLLKAPRHFSNFSKRSHLLDSDILEMTVGSSCRLSWSDRFEMIDDWSSFLSASDMYFIISNRRVITSYNPCFESFFATGEILVERGSRVQP